LFFSIGIYLILKYVFIRYKCIKGQCQQVIIGGKKLNECEKTCKFENFDYNTKQTKNISDVSRRLSDIKYKNPSNEVDAVITWVTFDNYQKELIKDLNKRNNVNTNVVIEKPSSRFEDHGMLLYCIRAIRMYLPWICNIYIACSDYHIEKVYDITVNEKNIITIGHSQFIPLKYLPTANSHAIEMHLYNIPNMKENFIAFNDDFFVIRPTSPDFFFDPINFQPKHYVKSWVHRNPSKYTSMHLMSWTNNIDIMRKNFELKEYKILSPAHIPVSINKSNFKQMLTEIDKNDIEKTAYSGLRSNTDIHTLGLYIIWSQYRKLSLTKKCDKQIYLYIGIKPGYNLLNILEKLDDKRPRCIVFNDESMTENQGKCLSYILSILLPE